MLTAHAAPATASRRSCEGTRQTVGAVLAPLALLAGSVLAAAGMALHLPALTEDVRLTEAIAAGRGQWMVAHLLAAFGFALVALGVAALLPLRRRRGAVLTAVGAVLTSAGATLFALADAAHGALAYALAGPVGAQTSLDVQESFFRSSMFASLNAGPLLVTAGMLLLGVGLFRSGLARWSAAAVALAPLAVNAAISLELPTYVHGVPFVLGIGALVLALRQSEAVPVEPAADVP